MNLSWTSLIGSELSDRYAVSTFKIRDYDSLFYLKEGILLLLDEVEVKIDFNCFLESVRLHPFTLRFNGF
jgi:hypothetical protein